MRPRKGSKAICSRCRQPAPGYDQLVERRFEFIPFNSFLGISGFSALLHAARRLPPLPGGRRRGGAKVVEKASVPWADGKRTLTKVLFLARWARRLSWKETAEALHFMGQSLRRC